MAATVPVRADDGLALDRLEALGSALRARAVWTAAYHQEYIPAGMTEGEEAHGRVWVAWPSRCSSGSKSVQHQAPHSPP